MELLLQRAALQFKGVPLVVRLVHVSINKALEKANNTKEILNSPSHQSQQHEKQRKTEQSGTASTIFRLVKAPTTNSSSSRKSSHNCFSSINHTDSDSTMRTQALNEDEHNERDMQENAEEQKEEEPKEDVPCVPTLILRHKKKDDGCTIVPTGRSVHFLPKDRVF